MGEKKIYIENVNIFKYLDIFSVIEFIINVIIVCIILVFKVIYYLF